MALPKDEKPAPVRTNRFGLIAAAILFAALVAYTIYFLTVPATPPPTPH